MIHITKLNPYISFKDNARQAMKFYQTVFGGKLDMTTFKDGGTQCAPSEENNIMHSVLETTNGLSFMASDTPASMGYESGRGISMTLSGEDEVELKGYWDKLSSSATIEQPLEKAPWGDTFGMLTDKFSVRWMINISGKKP